MRYIDLQMLGLLNIPTDGRDPERYCSPCPEKADLVKKGKRKLRNFSLIKDLPSTPRIPLYFFCNVHSGINLRLIILIRREISNATAQEKGQGSSSWLAFFA